MKAILGNAEGLTEEEQLQKVADEEAKEERKQSDSEDEIAKKWLHIGGYLTCPSLLYRNTQGENAGDVWNLGCKRYSPCFS